MKSGTIVVMGDAGKCAGACMTGGTIVLLRGQELLPTFIYDSAGLSQFLLCFGML